MNNIFMGSYTANGVIYDYSGIWSRHAGKIEWKVTVRNADVVCRPHGVIHAEPAESDVAELLRHLVARDIQRWIKARAVAGARAAPLNPEARSDVRHPMDGTDSASGSFRLG